MSSQGGHELSMKVVISGRWAYVAMMVTGAVAAAVALLMVERNRGDDEEQHSPSSSSKPETPQAELKDDAADGSETDARTAPESLPSPDSTAGIFSR